MKTIILRFFCFVNRKKYQLNLILDNVSSRSEIEKQGSNLNIITNQLLINKITGRAKAILIRRIAEIFF